MSDDARPNTPPPGRITTDESFLDLVDQIGHGDLATWRRLYAAAQHDAQLRAALRRASRLVDPDFVTAGALWDALVVRMPPVARSDAHDGGEPALSQAGASCSERPR